LRHRVLKACVLLLVGGTLSLMARAGTIALSGGGSARVERDGAPAPFTGREFPHLLPSRRPLAPDLPAESAARAQRPGNARISRWTGLPTVLRREPRFLSDREEWKKVESAAEPETVRILAVRVDFLKDSADLETTGGGRFDLRSAEEAKIPIDPPPRNRAYFEFHLEALRRYYAVQTGGALALEYDVYPQEADSAYHLPDTDRYGPWVSSVLGESITVRAVRLVRESLLAAEAADPEIPWKEYSSFLIFHAGADFQGDVRQDTDYDIPSFNLYLEDSLAVYAGPDSVKINLAMVMPESISQDEYHGALNGLMAHEFGHQLGFFDLYDNAAFLPVVGLFSLMDSGDSEYLGPLENPYDPAVPVYARGVVPSSLDPWHRALFFPESVRLLSAAPGETLSTALPGVLLRNDILQIRLHSDEYFLIENRSLDYDGDPALYLDADSLTGVFLGPAPSDSTPGNERGALEYDAILPGGGVLIWHIDEMAALEGLLTYGGVNVFGDRRGIDIEEADGIQDIGTSSNEFLGGPYDPYFVGGYTRFGPETIPDSRTNDRTDTGVSIEVLDPPSDTMAVRVGDPRSLPGWPLYLLAAPTAREALGRLDVNGDSVEEILLASGASVLALTSDSPLSSEEGFIVLLGEFADRLTEGVAVVREWEAVPEVGPVLMGSAGGIARWFDTGATLLGQWGERGGPDSLTVTAGPVVSGILGLVGCGDGRVVGLTRIPDGVFDVWTLEVPQVADSIVSLVAGQVGSRSPVWVAGGGVDGSVFVAELLDVELPPRLLPGWPQKIAGGAITSLLALSAPIRFGEAPRDLLLVTTEDGIVDLRAIDGGASVDGWPRSFHPPIAGFPAVGDLDSDGILEVAITTRSGDMHLWDLSGVVELLWPRSVWEPDRTRRPPTRSGPRLWDLGGDGQVEWIQMRGDGIVSVRDGQGAQLRGWPLATGSPGTDGPCRLLGSQGDERWFVTHAVADTILGLGPLPMRGALGVVVEDCVGCFPEPLFDAARSGVYPQRLVPPPQPVALFFDLDRVILHPNPVRGRHLKIRYFLGAPARLKVEAFDLSGRPRAAMEWDGQVGASGDDLSWDLGDLAPGAYLVKLRAEGEGQTAALQRMIAILR